MLRRCSAHNLFNCCFNGSSLDSEHSVQSVHSEHNEHIDPVPTPPPAPIHRVPVPTPIPITGAPPPPAPIPESPVGNAQNFQARGKAIREWIADPGVGGCHIGPSTLTYADLILCDDWSTFEVRYENPGFDFEGKINEFLAGTNIAPEVFGPEQPNYRWYKLRSRFVGWAGYVSNRAMILENLHRVPDHLAGDCEGRINVFYMSQISQAIYQRDFNLDELTCIIVSGIINEETLAYAHERLYPSLNLEWHDHTPWTYEYGMPQYDALMGTRIGKVVAYIVLGAFPRGTHRISQIVMQTGWVGASLNMRFDIERIN
ncbi:hypothetical protein N7490_011050 [Penicillium lividum]|nr:hypothetical protein N7490_011050 [Penicillium lividum]